MPRIRPYKTKKFDIDLLKREENLPRIHLPDALARKYPNAGKEWSWFYLFPSPKLSVDPRTLTVRRNRLYPTSVQRAFKRALAEAGKLGGFI